MKTMALSIAELKLAKKIGATHVRRTGCFFYRDKDYDLNSRAHWYCDDMKKWIVCNGYWSVVDSEDCLEIDFSPLDDYYADKNVDIAATGGEEMEIPDGWYRCDESGKIKPMKPCKTAGAKHDKGKPRPSLLPPVAITEMAKVMTFGADKYEAHGWRKVENAQERYLDALLRHAIAYVGGERTDPESGLPTMAHVMCNAAFLIELDKQQEQTK